MDKEYAKGIKKDTRRIGRKTEGDASDPDDESFVEEVSSTTKYCQAR